jgi:SPP1 gp7 family putative phage head morphogenesis protein
MAAFHSITSLYSAHISEMDAAVTGFEQGLAGIGRKLTNALIDIAGDNAWQSQSLARQITWIQSQLRGQLNVLGYDDLSARFVNTYDEAELFGRQILQTIGKPDAMLIPMRTDTVANLKRFDLSAFSERGNDMIRVLSRELTFNTLAGKKRSDVIESLKSAMDGQTSQATTFADTALRSFDRFVNTELWTSAGIKNYKYFGPSDNRTRPFCAARVGKVYTLAEIKKWNNGSDRFSNVMSFMGGPRCRHVLVPSVDASPEQ